MKTISVVSPCYNEEDNVEVCANTVRQIFDEHLPDYRLEHVFADNGSTDQTPEILRRMAAANPAIKVVFNARNFGVFRSSFNALRYATGDAVIVLLPVDLQDPPELIPEFVKLWESGYDIAAGARNERDESRTMRAARGIFYRIVNALSDVELVPSVGEFQLIDRKVLEAVLRHDDQYPYIRGIIASCGFRRVIVPYFWRARRRGVSKHNIGMLTDQALNAIFAFTRAPLRLCTLLGLVIALASILFSIASVVIYFAAPDAAPRGITTVIVALFFLSGIQMLMFGMLGEYITAIHSQVRGGPLVVERERLNVEDEPPPTGRSRGRG
ncbi:glycosyltransferase family 2 protein [Salipiger sp. PrR002]|uniref:glycosyltransferase family 2 protein n=1 Tax=Salipiger sp. PrR002 TaxID=2706489 RepID=UPI0013B7BE87|nr:glycosyltransferase family 2 protein [Salipiger sp. PrR002]NDV99573.1 glycosyltransferase [Salipiger sp. PrR002]NDW57219.1 glycosyltransferase [Salipiger sp. PrR004]